MASNRLLLRGIAFELVLTAAVIDLPWLQDVSGTAPLEPTQLAIVAPFPFLVWDADELVRAIRRRRLRTAPSATGNIWSQEGTSGPGLVTTKGPR